MTISREMRLGSTVLRDRKGAPNQVVHSVAGDLSKDGEHCVSFDAYDSTTVDAEIESIRLSLAAFCGEVALVDHDVVDTKGGPHRVFALFQTDAVVHFNEAPWHPDNRPGGKEYPRLVEKVGQGRPFTASYTFFGDPTAPHSAPHADYGLFMGRCDFGGAEKMVVRQDWPVDPKKEKCRIDIRIVPKSEEMVAPACDNCGLATIWKGRDAWCPNCHKWIEPTSVPSVSEAPAREDLSAKGGGIRLVQYAESGAEPVCGEEVQRVIDEFVGGGIVCGIFHMLDSDQGVVRKACADSISAAAIVSDWLAVHGVAGHSVNVTKCTFESLYTFRAEFQRSDQPDLPARGA